jgi:hypothetical protein
MMRGRGAGNSSNPECVANFAGENGSLESPGSETRAQGSEFSNFSGQENWRNRATRWWLCLQSADNRFRAKWSGTRFRAAAGLADGGALHQSRIVPSHHAKNPLQRQRLKHRSDPINEWRAGREPDPALPAALPQAGVRWLSHRRCWRTGPVKSPRSTAAEAICWQRRPPGCRS